MSISISQNDKFTIILSGDINKTIPLPVGVAKTGIGIKFTGINGSILEEYAADRVDTITDVDKIVYVVNSDVDILYNTLISKFTLSVASEVNTGKNALAYDAWGRSKSFMIGLYSMECSPITSP